MYRLVFGLKLGLILCVLTTSVSAESCASFQKRVGWALRALTGDSRLSINPESGEIREDRLGFRDVINFMFGKSSRVSPRIDRLSKSVRVVDRSIARALSEQWMLELFQEFQKIVLESNQFHSGNFSGGKLKASKVSDFVTQIQTLATQWNSRTPHLYVLKRLIDEAGSPRDLEAFEEILKVGAEFGFDVSVRSSRVISNVADLSAADQADYIRQLERVASSTAVFAQECLNLRLSMTPAHLHPIDYRVSEDYSGWTSRMFLQMGMERNRQYLLRVASINTGFEGSKSEVAIEAANSIRKIYERRSTLEELEFRCNRVDPVALSFRRDLVAKVEMLIDAYRGMVVASPETDAKLLEIKRLLNIP